MRKWIKYVAIPWYHTKRDNTLRNLAWMIPRPILYWAYIRAVSITTPNNESPMDQTAEKVLKRLAA